MLYIFIMIFIANISCNQYPDGPSITLNTKSQRICRTWDVAFYAIDGHDSTSYLKNQPFYGKYEFVAPTSNFSDHADFNYKASDDYYSIQGEWSFANNKKSLKINITSTSYPGNIGVYRLAVIQNVNSLHTIIWDIMRLEEKELWLQTTYQGKDYILQFNGY